MSTTNRAKFSLLKEHINHLKDNFRNNKQLFVWNASTGKREHTRTGLGEGQSLLSGSGSTGTQTASTDQFSQPPSGCSGGTSIASSPGAQLELWLYKSVQNHNLNFRNLLYSRTQSPKSNYDFINLTNPCCWDYTFVPMLPLPPASFTSTGKKATIYRGCTQVVPS